MSRITTDWPVSELEDEHDYDLVATRQNQIEHETPQAVKFVLDGTTHWVPRRLLRQDHQGIWVPSWFVEENGIGD